VKHLKTKFLILDGNSLACRAAFAHNPHFGPDLHTSYGKPTGATLRFLNMFDRILHQFKPTHILVAWDVSRETFRNVLDENYKANREPRSDNDLKIFFQDIKHILTEIGCKNVGVLGYEGDDIVGTYSVLSKADKTFIVSGDKDSFQLVNNKVSVIFPKNGFKEVEIITPQYIQDTYGISVDKFTDLKALMGDGGDNISGISGCGEKTAIKLLQHYGSADAVANNFDNIDLKGINKTVIAGIKEWAPRSYVVKQLVTIRKDVEVPYTFDQCKINLKWENAREIFKELELNSLVRKLNGAEFYG